MKRILQLIIWLAFFTFSINAQPYAINGNVSINTSSVPNLESLAGNILNYSILQTDNTKPEYAIKLKVSISGQGVQISTVPNYFPQNIIYTNYNIPMTLTGYDLQEYFNLNNLNFQGITKNQYLTQGLPEGAYSVCIEAYDLRRDKVPISNLACGVTYFSGFDPPIILNPIGPQFQSTAPTLLFSWQPQHILPPGSLPTQYELFVWERVPGMTDEQIISLNPPFYIAATSATNHSYLAGDTPFNFERFYIVRVRAIDLEGKVKFKNNGFSEVEVFYFVPDCRVGTACDDGDSSTTNDTWQPGCICEGTPSGCVDDDNDGVCNENDICAGGDDNIDNNNNDVPDYCDTDCGIDQPCDDGNSCTTNDVINDGDCNCFGTPLPDSDNDGICDAEDVCANGDDNIDTDNDGIPDACDCAVGSVCDDGNPCTTNDIIDADCNCTGELLDDNNTGVCDFKETPEPPVALPAKALQLSSFIANWESTSGAVSYELDIAIDPDFMEFIPGFENIAITGIEQLVEDVNIIEQIYYYRVRAVNEFGISENSNTIEVTPDPPEAPIALEAEAVTGDSFTALWTEVSSATHYILEVATDDTFTEFLIGYEGTSIAELSAAIADLDGTLTYYYRVQAENDFGRSDYSNVIEVKLRNGCSIGAVNELEYACGDETEINFDEIELTDALEKGDTIWAGDFLVEVTEVNGNGAFFGEGKMSVPFLAFAQVNVKFSNIKVDNTCRMVDGYMKVTGVGLALISEEIADAINGFLSTLEDIDGVLAEIEGFLDEINQTLNESEAVDDYFSDGWDIFENPDQISDEYPYIPDSIITQIEQAVACFATNSPSACQEEFQNAIQNLLAALQSMFDADYQIVFQPSPTQDYGFDTESHPAFKELYNHIKIAGEDYIVPWKSVESNLTDVVLAERKDGEAFPEDLRFENNEKDLIPHTAINNSNQVELTVAGKGHGEITQIYPVQIKEDSTGTEIPKYAGKLNVISYDKLPLNIVLVPVNGAAYPYDVDSLKAKLNKIYAPAVVDVTVTIATENLEVDDFDNVLDDMPSGILSAYNSEMNNIISAFKSDNSVQGDTYYLFMVQGSQSSDLLGFMPKKRKFGFIIQNNLSSEAEAVKTVAHEVAHGAYRLDHLFEDSDGALSEGDTENLMDYSANLGTELYKFQWDLIHDPEMTFTLFESDEDGENNSILTLDEQRFFKILSDIGDNAIVYCKKCDEGTESFNLEFPVQSFTLNGEFIKCIFGIGDVITGEIVNFTPNGNAIINSENSCTSGTTSIQGVPFTIPENWPDFVATFPLNSTNVVEPCPASNGYPVNFCAENYDPFAEEEGNNSFPVELLLEDLANCSTNNIIVRPDFSTTNNSIKSWKPIDYLNADSELPICLEDIPAVMDFTGVFHELKSQMGSNLVDGHNKVIFSDEETSPTTLKRIKHLQLENEAILWIHLDYDNDKIFSEFILPEFFLDTQLKPVYLDTPEFSDITNQLKSFLWEHNSLILEKLIEINDMAEQVNASKILFGTLAKIFKGIKIDKSWWDESQPDYKLEWVNDLNILTLNHLKISVAFSVGFWNNVMDNLQIVSLLAEFTNSLPHKIINLILNAEDRAAFVEQVDQAKDLILDENAREFIYELAHNSISNLIDQELAKINDGIYTGVAYVGGVIASEVYIATLTAGTLTAVKSGLMSIKAIAIGVRIIKKIGSFFIKPIALLLKSGYKLIEVGNKILIRSFDDVLIATINEADKLIAHTVRILDEIFDEIIFPPGAATVMQTTNGNLVTVSMAVGKETGGSGGKYFLFLKGVAGGTGDLAQLLVAKYSGLTLAKATQLVAKHGDDVLKLLDVDIIKELKLLNPTGLNKFFDDLLENSTDGIHLCNNLSKLTYGWIKAWKEIFELNAHHSLRKNIDFLQDFYESSVGIKILHVLQGPMVGKRIKHTFTKHGSHNTKQLLYQAKNGITPQGQWLDDVAAEDFIARHLNQLGQGTRDIPLPNNVKSIGRVFKSETGELVEITHIRLVPSGSGVSTAFPISDSLVSLNPIGVYIP